MPVLTVLLCILLAISAWAESSPELTPGPLCKIVDGDTFHYCDGLKVRLANVDTPERGEPFYKEAQRALAELLQTRNIQLKDCYTDSTRKRQACRVFADGKDVEAELVKQGFAWDWPKYSGGKYRAEEREARAAKRGFWVNGEAEAVHWAKRKRE